MVGAWRFNTRCLKSAGLTACHKTAWLIESPGMSSPAVLMNPKPKGLMKRAPFAKTVPRLDLPCPEPLPRHLRVGLHGDRRRESTGPKLSKGTKEGVKLEKSKQLRQKTSAHVLAYAYRWRWFHQFKILNVAYFCFSLLS